MELIIWFMGLLSGLLFMWIVTRPSKQINIDPNDFTIPEILPVFKDTKMSRGFNVDGRTITQSWKTSFAEQNRTITVSSSNFTQKDFEEFWYKNELNFYLKTKHKIEKEQTNV